MRLRLAMLILVALIFVALLLLYALRDSRKHGGSGFIDVLKNPESWRDRDAEHEVVERRAEAARGWDERRVAGAVRHFLLEVTTGREAWVEARILRELGPRTHQPVLDLLADPAQRARMVAPTGDDLGPEAPFNRACQLLGDPPPPGASGVVSRFAHETSSRIRKDAALVLGRGATPEAVPSLKALFEDPDEYVRSYALMGLRSAAEAGRLRDEVGRAIFDDVKRLVSRGANADDAADLLLRVDERRATEFLLAESVLTPGSASLHEILKCLADHHVAIPRGSLLALIRELDAGAKKYPRTYALGESLRLLGRHQAAEDRPLLLVRMADPDAAVAEGAAAGLLASHDLEGVKERLRQVDGDVAYSRLNDAQRQYLAVASLDGEVCNGGLSQYFVNTSGDDWRVAMEGLDRMNFPGRAAILRDAVAKFGKDGPSSDRGSRQIQLAKLVRGDEAVFSRFDEGWYRCEEAVEVKTTKYLVDHPELFR